MRAAKARIPADSRQEVQAVLLLVAMAASASLFALLSARWLPPDKRGVVVVVVTTGSILMLLGSLGVPISGRVQLGRSPSLDLQAYRRHAARLSTWQLAAAATAGIAILWFSNGLPNALVGFVFVPYAALQVWNYLLREGLHGVGNHAAALIADLLASVTQTTFLVALRLFDAVSLGTVVPLLTAGALVQALFLEQRVRGHVQQPPQFELTLRDLARSGRPSLVSSVGQAFVIRGDRLILGALATAAAVGVYGAAATLMETLWLAASGVAQVLFRRASMNLPYADLATSRQRIMALTAAGCLVSLPLIPWAVNSLLGAAYSAAIPICYILAFAALPMASYQLDVAMLNGWGRLDLSRNAALLGCVSLAIGCAALIPLAGAIGAALASTAGYSVMAITVRRYVGRIRPESPGADERRRLILWQRLRGQ